MIFLLGLIIGIFLMSTVLTLRELTLGKNV